MREAVADAYGIMPFERMGHNRFRIRPYVAVPSANSRVFERACGSGSLALALAEGREGGRITVEQPGGTLFVRRGERIFLEGEVLISCSGTVRLGDVGWWAAEGFVPEL